KAFNSALVEMGLGRAKIGVEFGEKLSVRIPTEIFVGILRDSRAEFVNGAEAIWDVRIVKTDFEVKRIQNSARIASRGFNRTFDSFRAGMSEGELARLLSRFMIEEG